MPLIYDTAPVVVPPRETVLVKYLDLTKFLSLLTKDHFSFVDLINSKTNLKEQQLKEIMNGELIHGSLSDKWDFQKCL